MIDEKMVIDYGGEAARLVRFRKHLKLSQNKFAKEIGAHQPFIAKVEKGLQTSLPVHYLVYLRKKYNLNLNWYFTGQGKMIQEEDDKSTLVSDLSTIKKDYEDLWKQLESLKKTVHKLASDFYAKD